ncbi:hypothetical protein [Streptomyces sp. NPDC090798]|uniref:hypothetical protein n=1 Tax=Streptomyces sp. NPDC090798 TaxID=3365968 RepID=UPI003821BF2D
MTDAPHRPFNALDFPADLRAAQRVAAELYAALHAYQAALPWFREPHPGWPDGVSVGVGSAAGFVVAVAAGSCPGVPPSAAYASAGAARSAAPSAADTAADTKERDLTAGFPPREWRGLAALDIRRPAALFVRLL